MPFTKAVVNNELWHLGARDWPARAAAPTASHRRGVDLRHRLDRRKCPIMWTKTPDRILAKIRRGLTSSASHH